MIVAVGTRLTYKILHWRRAPRLLLHEYVYTLERTVIQHTELSGSLLNTLEHQTGAVRLMHGSDAVG